LRDAWLQNIRAVVTEASTSLLKVWNQLKDSLEKLNRSERERSALELRIREIEEFDDSAMTKQRASERDEVKRLRSKVRSEGVEVKGKVTGHCCRRFSLTVSTRIATGAAKSGHCLPMFF